MQISRLFKIVYILLDKRITTAKELAEHFEVSIRTIYRDVEALSSAGIPIYASQGKGGGISLLDDFVLNKSLLLDHEQNEILIALQSLSVTEYPNVDTVLSKLSSLFKKDKLNWIEVDFSAWGSSKNQKEKFNILKTAIISDHMITFDYFNSSGIKSSRRVEPTKLIFKAKSWYLQGFCLAINQNRTFKISRMRGIEATGEIYIQRSLDEQPGDSPENQFGDRLDLQLRISSEGAFRVYDEFDENDIVKNEDGSFTITTSLPESDWLYNYILSFGTVIEAIEPPSVREIIAAKLATMLNKISR
ncbi:YafY family transcriptional regulator [Paenibacillus psychroresistens]|uniref:YafY family transcriptional regulator n=1 Tax=Paenibacillus psychroresistens TaxID=1778678 RepID=A0A6B8RUL5_9BACL|nr:YafY family protein [Paenibacillus psychroresistens]QGQ99512.1 YafY family transcriptional regulator [Paenibacillus psychroresistens]